MDSEQMAELGLSIEDRNYYNDPRVRAKKIEKPEGPFHWEICDVCRGNGTHVNPSIDCGGLTSQDFDEDPDFREDYMSGMYDVSCVQCSGSGKIPVAGERREE